MRTALSSSMGLPSTRTGKDNSSVLRFRSVLHAVPENAARRNNCRNTVHNGSLPDPLCQEVGDQSDTQRLHLRRVRCGGALQKCIEDPMSEVLIQGTINTRLAFIEVFLEYTKLYYRPLDSREARPCCCTRSRVCKFNWQRRSQLKVTNSTRRLGV